jgi:hypothetical protein
MERNALCTYSVVVHSAGVVESSEVREAVLCDENRRVVVFVLDPVQFLTESPRGNLQKFN